MQIHNGHPALNVKATRFPSPISVQEHFPGCDLKTAMNALQYVWDAHLEQFWDDAQEAAKARFGSHVRVYAEGRSGGWLYIPALPKDPDDWTREQKEKWYNFADEIYDLLVFYTSIDEVLTTIEANQWFKKYSEPYNFINNGVCLADLKQEAIEHGYGAIIRR